MPRNVEIKARIDDLAALQRAVDALADHGPELIDQDDTFFACARGRLKLRVFADGRGELIAYQRSDQSGPKSADYLIVPTADPARLHAALAAALGETGRVVKQRTLYLIGRTRVHLDSVVGLGRFLELEVVLRDSEPADVGDAEARQLLQRLGIGDDQLLAGAYVDLPRQPDLDNPVV